MIEPDLRIGVVGATGAVGRVTLQYLVDRGYTNIRTFASWRSAGGPARRLRSRGSDGAALGAGDLDVCFFSIGTQWSRELVPTRGRSGRALRGQVVGFPAPVRRPARRARGQRRARPRALRDHREPELLHDPADDGARTAPRRRGLTQRSGRDLPVGVGRRAPTRSPSCEPRITDDHLLRMDWEFDGARVRRGGRSSATRHARSSSSPSCPSARRACESRSSSATPSPCGSRRRHRSRRRRRSASSRRHPAFGSKRCRHTATRSASTR